MTEKATCTRCNKKLARKIKEQNDVELCKKCEDEWMKIWIDFLGLK